MGDLEKGALGARQRGFLDSKELLDWYKIDLNGFIRNSVLIINEQKLM